jgi:hypothetical protein
MGYLDNSSITVDAILTLKGRELLSKGDGSFNIVQFALGDDEVDYGLWNPEHPLGTDYYGTLIENMPITEAIPDETQALRYKLITLPKQSTYIPVVSVGNTSLTLGPSQTADITPNTTLNGNSNFGYTAILGDSTAATLTVTQPVSTNVAPTSLGVNQDAQSVAEVGFAFKVTAKQLTTTQKTTTITIIGNETGGSVTINLTVTPITAAINNNPAI